MAILSKRLFSSASTLTLGRLFVLLVAVVSLVVNSYADFLYYDNEFNVDRATTTGDQKWTTKSSLAPYYSNLRFNYYGADNSNFRRGSMGATNNIIALGGGTAYLQIDASTFFSSATGYDLSAGDLVYEAAYVTDDYHAGIGSFYNGITINDEQLNFIYHPGYGTGAFRIQGYNRSQIIGNQNIGFKPPVDSTTGFTMMKLTIHQNNETGNYEFRTQLGLASGDYTFSYLYTTPIETFGEIKSIGPYAYAKNNMHIDYIRLQAPFADDAVKDAKILAACRDTVIASDQPVHYYKFDNPSTNVIQDYGSNPMNGTATYIDMSVISELNQVADFSGKGSKVSVSVTNSEPVNTWTAEFFLNAAKLDSSQSLLANSTYSLRLTQSNSKTPGFTHYGVKDYKFLNPDGGTFDTQLLTTNEWIHVTFVNDGESMLLYIDGELVGKSTAELIKLPYTNNTDTYIGSGGNGTNDFFSGMIDYVALYDYPLSADQIWLHAHPTPEPATWALLILGAAGMLYWRKKK